RRSIVAQAQLPDSIPLLPHAFDRTPEQRSVHVEHRGDNADQWPVLHPPDVALCVRRRAVENGYGCSLMLAEDTSGNARPVQFQRFQPRPDGFGAPRSAEIPPDVTGRLPRFAPALFIVLKDTS